MTATPTPPDTRRYLLICGVLAGPVLLGVGLAQMLTREGFDLERHALSQLSLGPSGVVQVANFVVTGLLVIATARGLRGALGPGRAAVWGTRLLGGFGVGMVVAGVFVADPGNGFPVGTPDGPGPMSWHGAVHVAGFALAMVSWTAAMIVLARVRAVVCVTALVVAVAVFAVPGLGSFGLRAILVSAVQLGVVALLCVRALRTAATSS